jgi:hypothetical protein
MVRELKGEQRYTEHKEIMQITVNHPPQKATVFNANIENAFIVLNKCIELCVRFKPSLTVEDLASLTACRISIEKFTESVIPQFELQAIREPEATSISFEMKEQERYGDMLKQLLQYMISDDVLGYLRDASAVEVVRLYITFLIDAL